MKLRAPGDWWWCCGLGLSVMSGAIVRVSAQSPPPDSVKAPGWVPVDSVNPRIEVSVHRDPRGRFWRYIYRVSNRRPATQRLTKLGLLLDAVVDSAKVPNGWWAAIYNPPAMVPGVTFAADQGADDSWPKAATPGGHPVVLEIFSPSPPGPVRFYARGSTSPIVMDQVDETVQSRMPTEQEDARRGETVGPVTTP